MTRIWKTEEGRRAAFIQDLRDLADFLEHYPTVPVPRYTNLNAFVGKDEVVAAAKAGSWEKIYNANWFYLRKTFGGGLEFDVTVEREQVCRKVVTKTTTIPAQPERVLPAEEEKVVEEFAWVCDEPLLGGGDHARG